MVQDQPRAILSLGSSTAITAVRVTLRRGSRTYGSGSMPGQPGQGEDGGRPTSSPARA